jgi:hypothetical protein
MFNFITKGDVAETNKKILILGVCAVVILGVIAVIYYRYTEAVGRKNCSEFVASAVQKMNGQYGGGSLGATHAGFKNNTCYEDIHWIFANPDEAMMSITDAYTGQAIAGCTIDETQVNNGHGGQQSPESCDKYFKEFNELFYHLY